MYDSCIIIVIDASNYKNSEKVPFKAEIIRSIYRDTYMTLVKSTVTGKEYELYNNQILELLDIKEIESIIDIKKYGLK